jgi:hypothetical protein
MPYQGKPVHLLGDLLEIFHVVDREKRIIQQIIGDNVLESSQTSIEFQSCQTHPQPLVLMAAGHLQVEKRLLQAYDPSSYS